LRAEQSHEQQGARAHPPAIAAPEGTSIRCLGHGPIVGITGGAPHRGHHAIPASAGDEVAAGT
jgi:hypothetical protein